MGKNVAIGNELLMVSLLCLQRDRLDLQHHIYRTALDGKLYIAPIAKEKLGRVLDVGCGTGESILVGGLQISGTDHASCQACGRSIWRMRYPTRRSLGSI